MKNIVILSAVILTVVLMIGCTEDGGTVGAFVSWSDAAGRTANSFTRTLSSSDFSEADQTVTDYYNSLGSLVGKYTPMAFKVPLVDVVLLAAEGEAVIYSALSDTVDEEDLYADFTSGVSATDVKEIPADIYNGFFIVIDPMNCIAAGGGTEDNPAWSFQTIHEIDVKIDGYTETDFNIDTVSDYPERDYIGDNTFRFSFYELHPDPLKTPGSNYLFTDNISDTAAVLGGNDGYGDEFNLAALSNSNSTYPYFNTDVDVAFLSPSEEIDLTSTESLEISVSLDLTDMIEVYDNNTPADTTDDIIVFANDFWGRFTLTYITE